MDSQTLERPNTLSAHDFAPIAPDSGTDMGHGAQTDTLSHDTPNAFTDDQARAWLVDEKVAGRTPTIRAAARRGIGRKARPNASLQNSMPTWTACHRRCALSSPKTRKPRRRHGTRRGLRRHGPAARAGRDKRAAERTKIFAADSDDLLVRYSQRPPSIGTALGKWCSRKTETTKNPICSSRMSTSQNSSPS